MTTEPRILIANYAVPKCGVHQYGMNLFSVLRMSGKFRFVYADIQSLRDLDLAVGSGNYLAEFERFWEHGHDARTADAGRRPIAPDEAREWGLEGRAGFGVINDLFVPSGADSL